MSARWQDLKARSISAVVVGIAVLFLTWWDAVSFAALLLVAAYILLQEWLMLTRHRHALWILFGMMYIALALLSLSTLRFVYGWEAIFAVFALVWSADSAAYFIGKPYGRHKIVPRISPGKSWEGLLAGTVASIGVTAFILHSFYPLAHPIQAVTIGAAFAIVGLLGDLMESAMKRHAGVKDSGTLLPGHGGLFDRVDALMPCSLLAAILVFA